MMKLISVVRSFKELFQNWDELNKKQKRRAIASFRQMEIKFDGKETFF